MQNDNGGNAGPSMTRRGFVPAAGSALAGFTIVPAHVLAASGRKAPSDKLNIAGVGVGGMGAAYLKGCESENIVALCDVHDSNAAKTFARYPKAKTWRDYRKMLEEDKSIDAVIVGTPDHTHAVVSMAAIQLGKHVYCAKPMTRTIGEARAVAKAAREAKVASQMSVQSCASEGACATAEWVRAGVVGAVREVHVWTDRPIWPQGLQRPTGEFPVPAGLDWDLWLGPAPARPYHPVYHPFRFRGWYDFGTGALGDMACHSFHVVFRALELEHPASVQATRASVMEFVAEGETADARRRTKKANCPETFPHASIVTWDFPARGSLPSVRLHWYDGGLVPPAPYGLDPARPLRGDGLMFVGEKGALLSGFSGGPSLVVPAQGRDFTPPAKTLPRSTGHYAEWIAAAKGGPPANCNFDFGSLITEAALLGVIAQRTGRQLTWDAGNMRIPNDAEANGLVNPPYRKGWSL
jgi:predicted dehydrogenase